MPPWDFPPFILFHPSARHLGGTERGTGHSPGHTAVLLQGRFSRRGPVHWEVKEVVAQRRLRLCQPSPQLTEHELQEDHSSILASGGGGEGLERKTYIVR